MFVKAVIAIIDSALCSRLICESILGIKRPLPNETDSQSSSADFRVDDPLWSQTICPSNITLTSQAEVDAFHRPMAARRLGEY